MMDGDVAGGGDEGMNVHFAGGGACASKRAKELTGSVLLGRQKLGVGNTEKVMERPLEKA